MASIDELNIVGCEDIPIVNVEDCRKFKGLGGLGRNRQVILFWVEDDRIDVSTLVDVPLISIIGCKGIVNL